MHMRLLRKILEIGFKEHGIGRIWLRVIVILWN